MNDAPCQSRTPISDWNGFAFETRQVHAGEYRDANRGLRVPPVALSAGYVFEDFDDGVARFNSTSTDPIYSRQGNPTNQVAEQRLASLEGGSAAVTVSSGQAAITSAILTLAQTGDHIVSTASIYGGTRILFGRSIARAGIGVDYVWNIDDDDEWQRLIRPETKAIYTESVPNPLNDITDLRRIAEVAERYHLPVIVDNTVGTPALISPFAHGAHITVHSTTKFLSGHGAAVGGAIVDGGSFDWLAASRAGRSYPLITRSLRPGLGSYVDRFGSTAFAQAAREQVVNDIGPTFAAFNGFLLHQGLETLSLRMERHVDSSLRIAEWLEEQPEVLAVHYAGLPSNARYELAQRDYGGRTGAVFGVEVRGGEAGAKAFFNGLQIFSRMTGIGDTRSMVLHPLTSTHASFAPELNQRLGVTPGLLRLSVGLEHAEDLVNDLRGALDRVP